jgi:hypothetical protein
MYISELSLSHYSEQDRAHITKNLHKYSTRAAEHYLCRLFLQLRAARETNAFVILAEEDIQALAEIGQYVLSKRVPTPFDFPDVRGKLIEPDAFCNGLLNFSSPDILSASAVRSEPKIREYATKIKSLLEDQHSHETERNFLAAMVEAHKKSTAGARADKVFEVASWVVKPLHYIPVVGEVVGAVEDVKDLALKWLDRKISEQEWPFIGARMTDIAIRDYLSRKANIIGGHE